MTNKTKLINETDKLNDENAELKKYKTKYSLRKRVYLTAIITFTVLIVGIMGYSYYVGKHMATVYTPLIDATMEIKLESTIAYLWFEELLSGDRNRDIEQVRKHIEQADWYAKAMLQGGENQEGKFIPLRNDQLRKDINEVRNKIAEFKNVIEERYAKMITAKVDNDTYERYHAIFWDFYLQVDKVETTLQQIIVKNESLFSKIQYGLIFITLIISFILIIVFYRFEEYRLQNYLTTIKINKNLELEIIGHKQAEEELKATNQQLIASEQQLRAANQQLTATEQQLRASNQQLIADEEELRNSEYLLKESQEIAGLGSYNMDISSGIWKSSSILDNIFGLNKKYKKDVASWLQIVHPEDKTMMQDYFATNVLINHELFNKEYRIKRINDQQERWVHGMGKLEFNDDEDPIKMIGTIQDITERKQAEEKFKLLSLSVEQSTEGMAHADLNGNLIYINKAWCEMHGYKSSKNLLGKNLKIFHNKKQLENDIIPFNEEVKKNGTCSGEVGHITKEGKTFPTLMTSTLLVDAQGNPFAMVGIARDITERKRVEEKLISRNKELELFNEVTVGRELKMLELKKEINELLEKSGEKPKYEIPT